jgi:MFS family permease
MFQLAYLICTPIIGRTLHKIGRKNGILFGYVIITIATAGFGLLSFFDEA